MRSLSCVVLCLVFCTVCTQVGCVTGHVTGKVGGGNDESSSSPRLTAPVSVSSNVVDTSVVP